MRDKEPGYQEEKHENVYEKGDQKYCNNCGEQIDEKAKICPECGVRVQSSKGEKDKVVAGILAILLGSFGVHKFYLEKVGQGLLYLCFFWTGIPGLVGIIEGIIYLTKSDEEFKQQYG